MVANYVSTVARQVGCSISARHFNHVKRVAKKCMLASGIRIGGARVSPTDEPPLERYLELIVSGQACGECLATIMNTWAAPDGF